MRAYLATAAGIVLIVVCGGGATALYCMDHRPSHDLVDPIAQAKDAGEIIPGNIAPNPVISGSVIRRNQITDARAIYAVVQRALDAAPPHEGFLDQHDLFIDKRLSSVLPLHGSHLIELQCGTSGPFGQSFLTYRALTHRLDVTLPQLPAGETQLIHDLDAGLTSAINEYYTKKLQLNRIAPDTIGDTDDEDAILSPLRERLKDLEDKLALEGASFAISDTYRFIAQNTLFNGLSEQTDGNILEAKLAFDKLELAQQAQRPRDAQKAITELTSAFEKENLLWTNFPSYLPSFEGNKIQSWYGDVALRQAPQSVCLLARFRDLYPKVARPNKLEHTLMYATPGDNDLRGELIAWYLIDRRSGAVLTSKQID